MSMIKATLLWLAVALGALAAMWVLSYYVLENKRFFAPKFEEVRRDTFEQSKAYRDGLESELLTLRVTYMQAEPNLKPALASLILHKAAGAPADAFSPSTRAWLQVLRTQEEQP